MKTRDVIEREILREAARLPGTTTEQLSRYFREHPQRYADYRAAPSPERREPVRPAAKAPNAADLAGAIDTRARHLMTGDPSLDYAAALGRVFSERPDLYARYRVEARTPRHGV